MMPYIPPFVEKEVLTELKLLRIKQNWSVFIAEVCYLGLILFNQIQSVTANTKHFFLHY